MPQLGIFTEIVPQNRPGFNGAGQKEAAALRGSLSSQGFVLFPRKPRALLKRHLFLDVVFQLIDGQAHLLHGVPIPHSDAVVRLLLAVAHGVEIDGDAQRRADLVLAAGSACPMEPASS